MIVVASRNAAWMKAFINISIGKTECNIYPVKDQCEGYYMDRLEMSLLDYDSADICYGHR